MGDTQSQTDTVPALLPLPAQANPKERTAQPSASKTTVPAKPGPAAAPAAPIQKEPAEGGAQVGRKAKLVEKDSGWPKGKAPRRKVTLEGTDYCVVTLDEIDKYKELKEKYQGDTMKAFILYMHAEFLKDLAVLRRQSTAKRLVKQLFGALVVLAILVILGVAGKLALTH